MHLQDAGWQRLQAVEAQIQVDQVGQATQAGRQRGQGAPEAGTQGIPALPTCEGGRQRWPPLPGPSCMEGGTDLQANPTQAGTDSCRHWRDTRDGGRQGPRLQAHPSGQLSPMTRPRKIKPTGVCWETPLGSCRVRELGLSQRHIQGGGLGRAGSQEQGQELEGTRRGSPLRTRERRCGRLLGTRAREASSS